MTPKSQGIVFSALSKEFCWPMFINCFCSGFSSDGRWPRISSSRRSWPTWQRRSPSDNRRLSRSDASRTREGRL